MVLCEPFRQWVLEDSFGPLGRPPWETVGVQIVKEVAPFEAAKLGILNGSHSTMAYSGFLSGIEFIWQVMERQPFQTLCRCLVEHDVIPILEPPSGVNLQEYARKVIGRFENSALEHRTAQVAMDGSQKVPVRLLPIAQKRLAAGLKLHVIPFAVAAWMRYVSRLDADGKAVRVQDPLAERLAEIAEACGSVENRARELAMQLLGITEIFGESELVAAKEAFVDPIVAHLERLLSAVDDEAVQSYIAEFVATLPPSSI